MTRKFVWDGEKIREEQKVEDKKHSTKEILDSLDSVRAQIQQAKQSQEKLEKQKEQNKRNIESMKKFELQLREFEDRCIEIQKKKLNDIIGSIHQECYDKAIEDSDNEISKDPHAYTEEQKNRLPYLKYQNKIATHKKVSEKIARRIITKYIFEEPMIDKGVFK